MRRLRTAAAARPAHGHASMARSAVYHGVASIEYGTVSRTSLATENAAFIASRFWPVARRRRRGAGVLFASDGAAAAASTRAAAATTGSHRPGARGVYPVAGPGTAERSGARRWFDASQGFHGSRRAPRRRAAAATAAHVATTASHQAERRRRRRTSMS